MVVAIERVAVDRLLERETETFKKRMAASGRMLERARHSMPLGVPSSFQHFPPHPIYIRRASGSRMWDVDGHEYCDYHLGFGSLAVGHAHPLLVEALTAQLADGTMYAMPSEEPVQLAEEICRRFGQDQVRFANSGTEATMDAIRIARGATGRDLLIKIEGSYHGHHDAVMVSVKPPADQLGSEDHPAQVVFSKGVPRATADLTLVVPYNQPEVLERLLTEHAGKVAGVIMEPVMMNLGIVHPDPGYLSEVRRITREHDTPLIFDEVKTGATIAAGGASEYFGVTPDLICLAKSIGGGVPIGAIAGSRVLMESIATGGVAQLGTFNGNPLAMTAGIVTLTKILTPAAYAHLGALEDRLVSGCQQIIDRHELPMYSTGIGAKGCVMFSPEPVRDYRQYLGIDLNLAFGHWLYLMNRGIFMPPGADEQWTLSVQHTEEDIDRHLAVFEEFARDVTAA